MYYVAAGSVEESIRRIMERSYRGGHSASERLVREIYGKSTQHLLMALDFAKSGIELVRVYDNSEFGGHVRQLLSFRKGQPRAINDEIPEWLKLLFAGTEFDIVRLQKTLTRTLRSN
jgi:predicted ABC-type ATPase